MLKIKEKKAAHANAGPFARFLTLHSPVDRRIDPTNEKLNKKRAMSRSTTFPHIRAKSCVFPNPTKHH